MATQLFGPSIPSFRIQGTRVHAASRPAALEALRELLDSGTPHQVVTVNMDFLRKAGISAQFSGVLERASLSVPDGAPLVWMARYLGLRACERITGSDVIDMCSQLSAERGERIFLLGDRPEIARRAREVLLERHPGARIVGTYSPPPAAYPFPEELNQTILARVREAEASILFVAFGCPKQDLWIHDHLEELGVSIACGIGGSLNFFAGSVSRAPTRLQRLGLEWVYRLWKEPRRLWRRYLAEDLPFALRLLLAESGRRVGLAPRQVLSIED